MVRVPTLAEEDAKRPNRERECLVKERTRLVNRMKGALARLGIHNFRPTLRNAAEHLAGLHTPEGSPLPPNVAAELERGDIARLGLVIGQIKQLEEAQPLGPEKGRRSRNRWFADSPLEQAGFEISVSACRHGHSSTHSLSRRAYRLRIRPSTSLTRPFGVGC